MKIGFIVLTIILYNNICLHAQQKEGPVQLWTLYPGYIITHNDDTIQGFIKLNNYISNQKKAFFFSGKYDEKALKKYKPKKIKAYKVGPRFYESFKYKAVDATPRRHFFLRKIEGAISLYEWYFETTGLFSEIKKVKVRNIGAVDYKHGLMILPRKNRTFIQLNENKDWTFKKSLSGN